MLRPFIFRLLFVIAKIISKLMIHKQKVGHLDMLLFSKFETYSTTAIDNTRFLISFYFDTIHKIIPKAKFFKTASKNP